MKGAQEAILASDSLPVSQHRWDLGEHVVVAFCFSVFYVVPYWAVVLLVRDSDIREFGLTSSRSCCPRLQTYPSLSNEVIALFETKSKCLRLPAHGSGDSGARDAVSGPR